MKFVQIIEFTTTRPDELQAAVDEFLASTAGKRSNGRGMTAKDRDRPDTYYQIIEFPSYEAAMENSNRPETAEFSAQLAKVCDAPPTFRNLDVLRDEDM